MCDHVNFKAKVDVDRTVNKSDSGEVLGVTFRARVRVTCTECNTDFVFNTQKVSAEDNGQVLFAAIEPSSNFTPVIEAPPEIPLQ